MTDTWGAAVLILFLIMLQGGYSAGPASSRVNQSQGEEEKGLVREEDPFRRGRSIMEEVEARGKSLTEHTFLSMIIRDSSGQERKRSLEVFNEYEQNGSRKNLIRFTSPQMVRNTGLLSLERDSDGRGDQWLYLPILRKSKRIASSAKTNEFVGTDYTFEDLSAERLADFRYEYRGEERVNNHDCFIIKATPSEERSTNTGYKERIFFIGQGMYCPVEIHYYNHDGLLFKKWLGYEFINIEGDNWRPNREEMVKVREKRGTMLRVEKRLVIEDLDDGIFSQRELSREY